MKVKQSFFLSVVFSLFGLWSGVALGAPTRVINLVVEQPVIAPVIKLRWTIPTPGAGCTLEVNDIRYRAGGPLSAINWASSTALSGVPVPVTAGVPQIALATGLAFSTQYYFGIKVKDSCGSTYSLLSNVSMFTTEGAAKIMNVAWASPNQLGLVGFRLHCGYTSHQYDTLFDVGNNTSYSITGLDPASPYYCVSSAVFNSAYVNTPTCYQQAGGTIESCLTSEVFR